MPTVDERMAALEAKVEGIADLRSLLLDIRDEARHGFAQVERRFEQVERRFEQTDKRFGQVDQRFAQIDAKVDRNFVWVMGMMLTGFISVIGALIGVAFR